MTYTLRFKDGTRVHTGRKSPYTAIGKAIQVCPAGVPLAGTELILNGAVIGVIDDNDKLTRE